MDVNILMIRGLGRGTEHWGKFPNLIEQKLNHQTYTMDVPGMDSKTKKAPISILEITDQMRQEWKKLDQSQPWSIIAISLGGMIALDWAARYPDDFAKVITINTSSRDQSGIFERLSPFALKTFFNVAREKNPYRREKQILNLVFTTTKPTEELINLWVAATAKTNFKVKTVIKQLWAASHFKLPKKINSPLLVLAGKGDKLASYTCSEKIAKHFGADFKLHESSGHDIPIDAPDWLIQEIGSFL